MKMMKKMMTMSIINTKYFYILLLFFISIFCFNSSVKSQQLSDSSEVFALVISPGTELYAGFGHNAFWIIDYKQGINMIFHYGTFDYRTPNFYLKFIRGKLDYMLATQEYRYFMNEYTTDRRDVWKLKLNLNQQQKQKMFDFLMWQSQEANKYYRYDFFMDNCATRLRYVLEVVFGDSVVFPQKPLKISYRQAIKPYLRDKPWTRFGINLLLGLPADKKLNYYSAMFLPYFIDTALVNTTINTGKSIEPLVLENSTMIVSNFSIGKMPLFNPDLFFWIISILLIGVAFWQKKLLKINKYIDISLLSILSLVSILILFMWFITDHTPTKWNLNIIWINPLLIFFVLQYIKNKNKKLLQFLSLTFSIICFALIVSFPVFPQQFDTATIPIFLMLGVRHLIRYIYLKKNI